MNIINDRYRINKIIRNDFLVEIYSVIDLLDEDKPKILRIYHYNLHKNLIDYIIDNLWKIRNIQHINILKSEEFDVIKTVDSNEVNSLMYYSVSEQDEDSLLKDIINQLNLNERLNCLVEIMITINFLHFRGAAYHVLSPTLLRVSAEKKIKLESIFAIIEKQYYSDFSDFERKFLSPEYISKNKENDKGLDYYSLARIIEYLFLEEDEILGDGDKSDVKKNRMIFFKQMIETIENKEFTIKEFDLTRFIFEMINFFDLDYTYDLRKERDYLLLENEMVGRDAELSRILEFDSKCEKKTIETNLIVVSSKNGLGKTRFLQELEHRLKLRNRKVYSLAVKEENEEGLSNLASLMTFVVKDNSRFLLEKYTDEFTMILPEEDLGSQSKIQSYSNSKSKKYRVYNRVLSYLKEISVNKPMYLFLDNLQNSTGEFYDFIEYIIPNLKGSNIICVLSVDLDEISKTQSIKNKLEEWKADSDVVEIELNRLNLEEIGELIRNILGMGYINWEFSTLLFKESDGKPERIQSMIKYFYNDGQLYLGKKGKWTLNIESISDIRIPNKVNERTLKMLNNLDQGLYELLELMSIFNDLLPLDILRKRLSNNENLEDQLEDLTQKRLIELKLADWGYSYNISNIDVKKMIYYEIEKKRKIEMHKRAVTTIENLHGSLTELLFEELVYHLHKSGQQDKALKMIQDKISKEDNKSGGSSKYLLEKAYSILPSDDLNNSKLEILDKILYIEILKGNLKREDKRLTEYIALAKEVDSKYHILNAKRIVLEIYGQTGRRELFEKQIQEIIMLNESLHLVEFQAYSLTVQGNMNLDIGELEKGEERLKEALYLATTHNLSHQLGNICNLLGNANYLKGNHDEAAAYYERSYDYFLADRDVMRSVKPINNLGNIYVTQLNDIQKAISYYERGLEISKNHGLKKMQLIFAVNISEISKMNYDYDKALSYLIEANKIAVEVQDINRVAVCQNLLGSLYLIKEEYDKAYDCYKYVEKIVNEDKLKDLEFALAYYEFFGSFAFCFGDWNEATKYYDEARKLYTKIDLGQHYRFRLKLIFVEFFKNQKFEKPKLDELMLEYKNSIFEAEFIQASLIIALLSLYNNDESYALKYLNFDSRIIEKSDATPINKIRLLVLASLNSNDNILEQSLEDIELDVKNDYFLFKTVKIVTMASMLKNKNKPLKALVYYITAFENIYKNTMKLPTWALKKAYIVSRDTDEIKRSITELLKEKYNPTLEMMRVEDIVEERDYDSLNRYFDFSPIIDAMGNEEFSQVMRIHSYKETKDLKDTESLLLKLNSSYRENLELILSYLSKKTLSSNAYIIDYDKSVDSYKVVTSLNPKNSFVVKEGILKAAMRTEDGLLLNTTLDNSIHKTYSDFFSSEVFSIICLPIEKNDLLEEKTIQKKTDLNYLEHKPAFLYFESDRIYNKLDEETLGLINSMAYLVKVNLENNDLALIATTDKLTGAYTRKYYDEVFTELIKVSKATKDVFFVLMLDLDRFKGINDTYGHIRGDEVLRQVGEIVKTSIKSVDIFARYGGEEFVVILKYLNQKEAMETAEKIRRNIEKLKIDGISKTITISIGVSSYPDHSKFKDELIEKADQALYHSKNTGRNKVSLWNHDMDTGFERVDKLAGILTGISEIDNKNILGIIQITNLIKEESNLKLKIFKYLGELLNILDAKIATMVILKGDEKGNYTRVKTENTFSKTLELNKTIVDRVIEKKKGEFLIDWDTLDETDQKSRIPKFNSVIAIPMIKNGAVEGLTYLSVSLDEKEFDFNEYNLVKNYAAIFTSVL